MKCQICKFKYPVRLLDWLKTSDGYVSLVCGICALDQTNEIHGTNRTEFSAPVAEGKRQDAIKFRHENATHYVVKNSGNALFVKEKDFFESQGGLTEEWGKTWIPVIATSIGDARKQAAKIYDVELSHIHDGEQ